MTTLHSIDPFTEQILWTGRVGGYFIYRIPSLVVTPGGRVLAVCEGRRHNRLDFGEVDLLMRRSVDGGRSWSDAAVIASEPGTTSGNPCMVVDYQTGVVCLLFCRNPAQRDDNVIIKQEVRAGRATRTVWLTRSEDDGQTWSPPMDITDTASMPAWNGYGTGPGHGIQLASGRLLAPCYHGVSVHGDESDPFRAHVLYSDDHGSTWRRGGGLDVDTNESVLLETTDGGVIVNARHTDVAQARRVTATSSDGGLTFNPCIFDDALPCSTCHASLHRFSTRLQHGIDRVLFTNPASTSQRENLTVRVSYDECRNWTVARQIRKSRAAYSDLAVLQDGTILCMYEADNHDGVASLMLARFTLAWVTNGMDVSL